MKIALALLTGLMLASLTGCELPRDVGWHMDNHYFWNSRHVKMGTAERTVSGSGATEQIYAATPAPAQP